MIPQQPLSMIPKNQYSKLMELFDDIYNEWIIDNCDDRRKYFIMFFEIIKEKVENLFRDNNFWIIYSLDKQRCDYIYKDGTICNTKIHIKYDKKKYGWRCYDHISKTLYNAKRKEINPEKICIGERKYGKSMIPCKELKKKNSEYCRHHHIPITNPNMNKVYFDYYFNKVLFDDIIKEHNLYLKDIEFKKEIELFNNIIYENNNIIDFINIRYNTGLCLKQNNNMSFVCNGVLVGEEDYCIDCLEKKK